MIDREQFKALAAQFRDLQDANKDNVDKFLERVGGHGIDRAGFRRYVARKRQNSEKRAQQEAIDQQCLYLAGERDTPAQLPIGCELARALNCFRRNMTVLQAAEELGVSNGKAGKLRQLARMFDTSIHTKVDGRRKPKLDVITPPEVAALPAHDADGVVIESPAAKASDAESPQGPLTSTDLAGAAGSVDAPAPITESCGGGESRPASDLPDSNLTDESRAVVSAEQSPSSNKALPQVREASQAQGEAGLASGPQEPIEVVPSPASSAGDERPLTPEPDVARAVPPATDPDKDDLAYPDFLDARKRRQPEAAT
jgi:hypothetical protein